MKTSLVAALLLVVPSLASAQQAAPAPGANDFEMSCALFRHYPDGSWSAARPMTMQATKGPIALKPSYRFRVGTLFDGFDFAAALDASCGPH